MNHDVIFINDGQDLLAMNFQSIISQHHQHHPGHSILYVGLHCSTDRKNEYGTAGILDFAGRGISATAYQACIIHEVMPLIRATFKQITINNLGYAGFSLGGLSALDMVINHPKLFSFCGVFSGSLWWRDVDQTDPGFDENANRIIHKKAKTRDYHPDQRFFFEAGQLDETADRNKNGIIDAIDDTIDLINILEEKGYEKPTSLHYLELEDGKHDVETWGRAFPAFLGWLSKHVN